MRTFWINGLLDTAKKRIQKAYSELHRDTTAMMGDDAQRITELEAQREKLMKYYENQNSENMNEIEVLEAKLSNCTRQLARERTSVDELARHSQEMAHELAEARMEIAGLKTERDDWHKIADHRSKEIISRLCPLK